MDDREIDGEALMATKLNGRGYFDRGIHSHKFDLIVAGLRDDEVAALIGAD